MPMAPAATRSLPSMPPKTVSLQGVPREARMEAMAPVFTTK